MNGATLALCLIALLIGALSGRGRATLRSGGKPRTLGLSICLFAVGLFLAFRIKDHYTVAIMMIFLATLLGLVIGGAANSSRILSALTLLIAVPVLGSTVVAFVSFKLLPPLPLDKMVHLQEFSTTFQVLAISAGIVTALGVYPVLRVCFAKPTFLKRATLVPFITLFTWYLIGDFWVSLPEQYGCLVDQSGTTCTPSPFAIWIQGAFPYFRLSQDVIAFLVLALPVAVIVSRFGREPSQPQPSKAKTGKYSDKAISDSLYMFNRARKLHDPYRTRVVDSGLISRQGIPIYHEPESSLKAEELRRNEDLAEAERCYLRAMQIEEQSARVVGPNARERYTHLSDAISASLEVSVLYRQREEFDKAAIYANRALDHMKEFPTEMQGTPPFLRMRSDALLRLTEMDHFRGTCPAEQLISRYAEIQLLDEVAGDKDGLKTTVALIRELGDRGATI